MRNGNVSWEWRSRMFGKSRHEDDKYAQDVGAVRRQKDEYFASSPQSPIPHEERHHGFAGLSYFPPDPAFRVRASVNPYPDQHIVQLGTTTGDIQPQVRYAELRFHLADRDLRLRSEERRVGKESCALSDQRLE